ncbi:MAG TPA: phospholipid carrier-dependent glycosyltransferase, partial [Candidatus Binataceae bacterium]
GWWMLLQTGWRRWLGATAAFVATFAIGVLPFQLGHPWNWILELYSSTAAYYHETSVNAFNLMALAGGVRQFDSDTILGVSYFALGMSLLVPLYVYAGWIIWRRRDAHTLIFAAFVTIFGFFMLAPRMHERYLFPALVLAVPITVESIAMLIVFFGLTLTCLFNLAYVLHTLRTVVFLDARDVPAMIASAVNLGLLAVAVSWGVRSIGTESRSAKIGSWLTDLYRRFSQQAPAPPDPVRPALRWTAVDTAIVVALLVSAAATRFWNLGHPPEIVFDEVHFVGQARHYLHGEWFLDPHPPLAKLVIAAGIWMFGDHPWSWRFNNAVIGTAMVGVTFLLGRRMFRSRVAAALAAGFILGDGMFLVDSRIAVIDITYLTLAAISYLLLFRFSDTDDLKTRRSILPWLGLALGLCVGSKLYIPAVTFVLVMGFLVYVIARGIPAQEPPPERTVANLQGGPAQIAGAVMLVGSIASIAYVATFLPHYYLGWWGGVADLFHYYKEVIGYESSVASATHPYASPWWSWPLMLRPIAYWQNFPATGKVSTIWGGGNPLLWWGALTAVTITTVQAFERPNLTRSFLVLGYLAYIVVWVWIGRTLFLYHYMASIYIGYLALASVLAQCWEGNAEPWEHMALLFTMVPAFVLGLGPLPGVLAFAGSAIAYCALLVRTPYAGKFVCAIFVAAAVVLSIYYFPVWVGMPIDRAGYYSRMWIQGPGLRNWI